MITRKDIANQKNSIILFLILISCFMVLILIGFYYFGDLLIKSKESEVKQILNTSSEKINSITLSFESKLISLANSGVTFYSQRSQSDFSNINLIIKHYIINEVKQTPDVLGCGLWFEPYKIDAQKKYYSIYAYRYGDSSVKIVNEYNDKSYDYFNWSWYNEALPKSWNRFMPRPKSFYWISPFYDPVSKKTMITASALITAPNREIIGVASCDWNINTIQDFLRSMKIIPNSYSFIIHESSGAIIANTFDTTLNFSNFDNIDWLKHVKSSENGEVFVEHKVSVRGNTYNLYFMRTRPGFLVGLMVSYQDVTQSINNMTLAVIGGALIISIFIGYLFLVYIKKSQHKLIAAEKRYALFLDFIPAFTSIRDENDRLIYANKHLADFYLKLNKKTSVSSIEELDNLIPKNKYEDSQVMEKGYIIDTEEIQVDKNESKVLETHKFAIKDTNEPSLLGGISFDITERKLYEKIQKAIYKISQFASTTENINDLYEIIHEEIARLMPANNFYIVMWDKKYNLLHFPYFVDEFDENPITIKPGRSLTNLVLKTGKAWLVSPELFIELSKRGDVDIIGAPSIDWLGVPLKNKDEIIGAMVVQSYTDGVRFTNKEKDILGFVAEQIAMFIRRKQIEEELQTSYKELENRVEDRTAQLKNANEELMVIIEQKNIIENQIRESEERFRTMADSAPVMIWMSDIVGNLNYFNKTWFDFTGKSESDHRISDWLDFVYFGDIEHFQTEFEKAIAGKTKFTCEFRMLNYAEEYRWVLTQGVPRFLEAGDFLGFIGSTIDITELKKTEQKMQEALEREKELNDMKTRFVSMVSHEYKTPLTSMLTSTYLIEKFVETGDVANTSKFIKLIQKSVKNMSDLLNDILTISKAESGKFNPDYKELKILDFCFGILEEIKAFNNSKDQIVFIPDKNIKTIQTDEKLLRQILINLLSNSVKYSPDDSPVEFIYYKANDNLIFKITDYGIGIPEDDLEHLFEPFHRAKNADHIKGTGLGLSIVKQCAEGLGGKIAVNSKVQKGSTFTVTLPIK